jgi:hypothetical protein
MTWLRSDLPWSQQVKFVTPPASAEGQLGLLMGLIVRLLM